MLPTYFSAGSITKSGSLVTCRLLFLKGSYIKSKVKSVDLYRVVLNDLLRITRDEIKIEFLSRWLAFRQQINKAVGDNQDYKIFSSSKKVIINRFTNFSSASTSKQPDSSPNDSETSMIIIDSGKRSRLISY